jgi:hypothetical protein
MKIDRAIQRNILEVLERAYPQRRVLQSVEVGCSDVEQLGANIRYLEEHGLVDPKWAGSFINPNVSITARGLDFLADDGGLSAILGVVTVRLHEDTVKAILLEHVEASNQPATVKSKIKEQIVALPAEGLKTIVVELLKKALAQLPDAALSLQAMLGG